MSILIVYVTYEVPTLFKMNILFERLFKTFQLIDSHTLRMHMWVITGELTLLLLVHVFLKSITVWRLCLYSFVEKL